jgi:hypothetical protein
MMRMMRKMSEIPTWNRSEWKLVDQEEAERGLCTTHTKIVCTISVHRYRDTARRNLLDKIIQRTLKQAVKDGRLTLGAREAFETYRLEHEMYTTAPDRNKKNTYVHNRIQRKNIFDEGSDGDKKIVAIVNPRGNLMDDLPMLSLVDRQVFQDTFYLFYSTTRVGLWVKWVVRNLDFFPFLRFLSVID